MKLKYTVKNIVFITLLLLFILTASIISQLLISKDSQRLEIAIDRVLKSTENDDWTSAKEETEELSKKWRSVMGLWSALIDHDEIDNIDVTLLRLKSLINSRDKATALCEATALKKYIGHIPEKEKLNIENLF